MNRVGTVAELLSGATSAHAGRVAISTRTATLTYTDLADRTDSLARALNRQIDHKSTRVAVCTGSKIALAVAFYGTAGRGRAAMLCSEDLTPFQLQTLLSKHETGALIVDDSPQFEMLRESYPGPVVVLTPSGEVIGGKEAASDSPAFAPDTSPSAEALVLFTSGTTGGKKAVSIDHRNLIEITYMINGFMELAEPATECVTVPLTHAFGLRRLLCVHLVGGTLVAVDGGFNPARTLQTLRDSSCDALSAVPSVIAMLQKTFPDVFRTLAADILYVELGSASLSAGGKADLRKWFPSASIAMHYGLTEASKVSFLHFTRDSAKLHTVGRPSPGVRVKLMDEAGGEAAPGDAGEVWTHGSNVATGYLDDAPLTGERFVDGWFRTGDLARFDADGYLELLGRTDEMINVGGKKMYPLEIEELLKDAYPAIDCAIAARDDAHLGSRPVLCYDHKTPVSPELFREIVDTLARRVESYKLPVSIVEVFEIPRTPNGKVRRRELETLYQEVGS